MDDQDDTSPSPVVARADALMQRRRAQQPVFQPAPVPDTIRPFKSPDLDDLPVLTDIADDPAPSPPLLTEAVVDDLAEQLAHHLKARLAAELPSLVEASLQAALPGLTDELRQGLNETANAALRDFLANHPIRQR